MLPGDDVASEYKVVIALRTQRASEAELVLEKYIKRVAFLNTPSYFNVIMGLS